MSKFIKALISVVIVSLLFAVGVYAYETIWSGKAHITIEPPDATSSGQLEVTDVTVSEGTWNSNTGTWTVSLKRGDWAALYVYLENTGGDAIVVHGEINGESSPSIGGLFSTSASATTISTEDSGRIAFQFAVKADASPGVVSDIELTIVEGPAY